MNNFIKTTRFINLVYHKNDTNKGIGYTLNKGVEMCSNKLIIKMDSDDIMVSTRIYKQIEFMNNNPHVMICGSQIKCFKDNIDNVVSITSHKSITWDEYKQNPSHWFSNHPSLCYRKSAILQAGNYDVRSGRAHV